MCKSVHNIYYFKISITNHESRMNYYYVGLGVTTFGISILSSVWSNISKRSSIHNFGLLTCGGGGVLFAASTLLGGDGYKIVESATFILIFSIHILMKQKRHNRDTLYSALEMDCVEDDDNEVVIKSEVDDVNESKRKLMEELALAVLLLLGSLLFTLVTIVELESKQHEEYWSLLIFLKNQFLVSAAVGSNFANYNSISHLAIIFLILYAVFSSSNVLIGSFIDQPTAIAFLKSITSGILLYVSLGVELFPYLSNFYNDKETPHMSIMAMILAYFIFLI